ncbi:MFS transporter [Salinisphaera sp.]|uniref:MFS transporter n=1 Tax=Salinisphaera sp. TaxID=1914330 RepID=UPI000C4676BA|nr:MFS transporter [Salinisphaera sp.]MBS64351.1 MFS transporter [Salinisphaera sp.]
MTRLATSLLALIASIILLISGNAFLMTLLGLRLSVEGFSTSLIGWILVCYSIGFTLGTVFAERVVERVGHIRAFAVFAAALAVTIQIYPLAVNAPLWAGLRAFAGFAMAGLMIVMESWFSSRATNDNRARLFAVYQIVFFLSTASGQLLINVSAPENVFPFTLAAMLVTVAVIPLSLTRMDAPAVEGTERLSLVSLYRTSPVGVSGALIAGLLVNAFYAMAPVYADRIGLPTDRLSLFMASAIVGAMLLAWPIGRLCDRFNRRRVLMGVLVVAAMTSAAIPFVGNTHAVALICVVGLYMGLSAALYPVSVAITNDQMPSHRITAASTTLLLAYGIGSCIGPVVSATAMDEFGPNGLFYTNTVFLVVLGVYLLYRLQHRADVPVEERVDYYTTSPQGGYHLYEIDPRNTDFNPANQGARAVGIRIGRTVFGAAGRAHAATRGR